jgi:hypothetical protein
VGSSAWAGRKTRGFRELAFCHHYFSFVRSISVSLTTIKLKTTPVIVALFGTVCRRIRNAELYDCCDLQAIEAFLFGVHETIERLVLIGCGHHEYPTGPQMHSVWFPKLAVLIIENSCNQSWNAAMMDKCPALQQLGLGLAITITCRSCRAGSRKSH